MATIPFPHHPFNSTTAAAAAPPSPPPTADDLKRAAARAAVDLVQPNTIVGLGTGSTAAHALQLIAERLRDKTLHNVVGIPTSVWAHNYAASLGIPLATLDDHHALDLAIDGADEVDPHLNLVKGRGGSLLREKMVESSAEKFVVIVDQSKLVQRLGGSRLAVPVEVVQFGWELTARRVRTVFEGVKGFELRLRTEGVDAKVEKEGCGVFGERPFVTDNGNYIVDLFFEDGIEGDLKAVGDELLGIVGVVEHGMFLGMATTVIVAGEDGVLVKNREDLR